MLQVDVLSRKSCKSRSSVPPTPPTSIAILVWQTMGNMSLHYVPVICGSMNRGQGCPRSCASCGRPTDERPPASIGCCRYCSRPTCSWGCLEVHEASCGRRVDSSDNDDGGIQDPPCIARVSDAHRQSMVASMSHFAFPLRNGNIDLSGEDLINKDEKEKEKEK